MSKQKLKVSKSVRFGKSDFRYWKSRLFKNSYTRDGVSHSQADYSVKIQFDGKRETFNLNISNKDLASKKAVKIYQSLLNEGMDKFTNPRLKKLSVQLLENLLENLKVKTK